MVNGPGNDGRENGFASGASLSGARLFRFPRLLDGGWFLRQVLGFPALPSKGVGNAGPELAVVQGSSVPDEESAFGGISSRHIGSLDNFAQSF